MKKNLILAMILTNLAYGQITLEKSYPGASSYFAMGPGSSIYNQLYVVRLEVAGDKYVHIDRNNKTLTFYNLNHTLFKTISFAALPDVNSFGDNHNIFYISQHLFDNDDEIEFLCVEVYAYTAAITGVINEDGTVLFSANNESNIVVVSAPQSQVAIFNTTAGTKMILSAIGGAGNGQVYSLPGTLSAVTVKSLDGINNESFVYPNPTQKQLIIENTKATIEKINIIDLNGKLISTYGTNHLHKNELDISNLNPGFYILQTYDKTGKLIENKQFIKE